MAKQTVTTLLDDLDGGKADSTVTFGWNGRTYEIDLSKKNAAALEKVLAPYVSAARSVRSGASRPASRGRGGASRGRTDSSAVREWARANGWPDLANRGRIPAEVESAYHEAN